MPIADWRNQPRGIDDYAKYFRAYDDFVGLFGKEIVDRHIMSIPFHSLVKEHESRNHVTYYQNQGYPFLGQRMCTFEIYNGEWHKTVQQMGWVYLTPEDYQGLKHPKVTRPILQELRPWLSLFKLDVYSIESGPAEFYVTLQAKSNGRAASLYVPYKAFLNDDADAVLQRNINYFSDYYRGRGAEEYVQMIVNHPVTMRFIRCMMGEADQVIAEENTFPDQGDGI